MSRKVAPAMATSARTKGTSNADEGARGRDRFPACKRGTPMTEFTDFHDMHDHDAPDTSSTHHLDDTGSWLNTAFTDTPDLSTDFSGAAQHAVMHGDPSIISDDWFLQRSNGYCVPAALTEVLSQIPGNRFADESIVVERFAELGDPVTADGQTLEDAEKVLESFGVESHVESDATMADLEHYLDEGRAIILGVNADEIWHGHNTAANPTGRANHALLITAIDGARGQVILADPGSPQGNNEI